MLHKPFVTSDFLKKNNFVFDFLDARLGKKKKDFSFLIFFGVQCVLLRCRDTVAVTVGYHGESSLWQPLCREKAAAALSVLRVLHVGDDFWYPEGKRHE